MDEIEGESKEQALKSHIAIRCAKAAILLSSLKCSTNDRIHPTPDHQHEERESMLMRQLEDLRTELVRERTVKRKMRLCRAMELTLQLMILSSLWILSFMYVLKFI